MEPPKTSGASGSTDPEAARLVLGAMVLIWAIACLSVLFTGNSRKKMLEREIAKLSSGGTADFFILCISENISSARNFSGMLMRSATPIYKVIIPHPDRIRLITIDRRGTTEETYLENQIVEIEQTAAGMSVRLKSTYPQSTLVRLLVGPQKYDTVLDVPLEMEKYPAFAELIRKYFEKKMIGVGAAASV